MISEVLISSHKIKIILAYVDPGTGSYLLQLLIATVLGGLFVIKTYWRRIIDFLSNKFSKSKES